LFITVSYRNRYNPDSQDGGGGEEEEE
jgi:hypothetical protein